MKSFLLVVTIIFTAASVQAADVGVSISVGEPGFYGRIDIGNYPTPQIIYPKPIIIQRPAVKVAEEPVYLHVPPGHAKKWRKHCHQYNACDKPVYFVRDKWYNDVYVPQYRERMGKHDKGHDQGRDRDRGHGKGRDKD
jgi:hypothetical protein